jgi:lipoprotein-anchoring transpeptidase ErfK/SrfK
MSEYYDALASAVANLKPADQPARYAFYDRARRMVLQRLQSVDPPMADADIRTEMNAFNAAIRQLENDILRPKRPPPAAPQPAAPPVPAGSQARSPRATLPHPETPRHRPAPPRATPRQAAPRLSSSLDIPPEFVGETVPDDLATAEAALTADADVAQIHTDTAVAPHPPAARTDRSRRRVIAVVAAALVVGILGAGAYALWERQDKAPVRTAARPAATAPAFAPSAAPPARVAVKEPERPTADGDNMPYILRRQLVYYRTTHPPGTLVISKSQNFLYIVRPNSTAMRYTIGLAPDTSEASGLFQISRKDDGSDGLSLGDSKFRIKQTNAPITIGRMSPGSGFQLVADDFSDLFKNTELGTRVVVAN